MRFDATSGRAWLIAAAFAAITVASIAPIRSNDYFWHLATGRWIWEHRALPATDPFGVASSREPWINTEWLFDAGVYPVYRLGGHAAVSWTLALATAALFCAMFVSVVRRAGEGAGAPLLLIIISWYLAEAWIRERPSAVGAACLAILLMLLMWPVRPWTIVAIFATTVVWANVHPSAILAPIIVALFMPRRVDAITASAVALLVNPFGVHGVLAPFRLVSVVREFHNEEWAPTTPGEFPFFYAIVIATLLLFAIRRRREDLPRALAFLLLTVLAIRFCRNQALFFVALPLLAGPSLPPLNVRMQRVAGVAAAAVMIAILSNSWFRTGIDTTKFPVNSVARLRASHLPGPIYNTYGLGGFLIWSFYPERRVITDGRNELYVEYNREHDRALHDIREWHRFLEKYNLRIAVYDYDRPMVKLENGREVPPAAVYFPPREWALVARDEVAMVFVRRR
ncbi:MAG: hypothetical protein ACXV5L_01725 [Thermoanaerobaculia bacterium]